MATGDRLAEAYCPHCQLLVANEVTGSWPPAPMRCPHCRLLIGASRALAEPNEEPGARGAAAGVFAQEARHSGDRANASAEQVRAAIRDVAARLGTPPERLLMVDYQQEVAAGGGLPSLGGVFGVYGSWKEARRRAGESG